MSVTHPVSISWISAVSIFLVTLLSFKLRADPLALDPQNDAYSGNERAFETVIENRKAAPLEIHLMEPFPVTINEKPLDAYFGHASPDISDFDQDGNFDLIVGQSGGSWVKIFRNRGSAGNPVFTGGAHFRAGSDLAVIPSGMPVPRLIDLNHDRLNDLIFGSASGEIYMAMQNRNRTFSKLEPLRPIARPGLSGSLGRYLSLDTVDWDGDGDTDILVGNQGGEIFVLNNLTRPEGKPTFAKIGSLDISIQPETSNKDASREIFPISNFIRYVSPHAVDWNQDGFMDVIFGSSGGDVYIAFGKNNGPSRLFSPAEILVRSDRSYALNDEVQPSGISVQFTKPVTCDWNSDGVLDLVVGDHFELDALDAVQTKHGFLWVYLGSVKQ